MRISVFGIGYVGAVTAACLAEGGHEVTAVDIDIGKIDRINGGHSPVAEPGLDAMIGRHAAAQSLKATPDAHAAVFNSDLSLICVGTPSDADGRPCLDAVLEACRGVARALAEKESYHIVVLRSTVLPGTARQTVLPILEALSGKKPGRDFGFGNNPEFLREGSAIEDYFDPPQIVIGAIDEKTASGIAALYKDSNAPVVTTGLEIAESVKYAANAWHATKIGFANEMGRILQAHDVDSHEVMDIFCLDEKLNISKAYLKPGFAFGGSCLPKDLRALQAVAESRGVPTPLFDAVLEGNELHIARAAELVRSTGKKRIGLIGLAFKAGTDDLRESPYLKLARILLKRKLDLKIYDPVLASFDSLPDDLGDFLVEMPQDLFDFSDVIVAGHHYPELSNLFEAMKPETILLDLARLEDSIRKRVNYKGICW